MQAAAGRSDDASPSEVAQHRGFQPHVDEALAQRSVAGVLAYGLLLAVLLGVTSVRRTHPAAAASVLAWVVVLGAARLAVARTFQRFYPSHPTHWRLAFRLSTLLAGLSWGVGCAVWTRITGWGAESVIVLVTTAGITAGATTSLNPSLGLVRGYVAAMLVPTIVAMTLFEGGTHFALTFGLILALYLGFLFVEAGHLHAAFISALEHNVLLHSRADALAKQTRSMRLVLDNVEQGFLKVDLAGHMDAERSAILHRWLGPSAEGETLWDYVGRTSPVAARRLQLGWEELRAHDMPVMVVLDQLPTRITAGAVVLDLAYRPLSGASTEVHDVLLILSDVTATLAKERSEQGQRELVAVFEHIQHDRAGLLEFLEEGNAIVAALAEAHDASDSEVRRWIHTLKGNAALFGLESVAQAAHALEDSIELTGSPISMAQRRQLEAPWRAITSRATGLLAESRAHLEVRPADQRALREAIARGEPPHVSLALLDRWELEPTDTRLERIAAHAVALAERLGKQVRVEIHAHGVRLAPAAWASFWLAFAHVLRNAIDHGIETPELRLQRDKPPAGRLWLTTETVAHELVVSVRDDGAGIDWRRVAERAAERGMPHATRAELEAALFAEGVSTAERVSQISGRGIGLGAFRQEVESRGGTVVLSSELGVGTTWQARFPWPLPLA